MQVYFVAEGDSMTRHKGQKFSTPDQDNDTSDTECAKRFKGAWWYKACHSSNLNGLYLGGPHDSFANGVNWQHWTADQRDENQAYPRVTTLQHSTNSSFHLSLQCESVMFCYNELC